MIEVGSSGRLWDHRLASRRSSMMSNDGKDATTFYNPLSLFSISLKLPRIMKFAAIVSGLCLASSVAYSPAPVNRREMFQSFGAAMGATAIIANPSIANALDSCAKGSKNCIRTEWTPPAGTSKEGAIASLQKVLNSYPQEGQEKVDMGGWTVVSDLSSGSGSVEFKSGIGNFAKFFNGGKPFVDDLNFEVTDSGVVAVKSSSRIGDSDLGVNQKRLNYFVSKLRADGWTAPDPTY